MRDILLSPPAAFAIYLVLVGILAGVGRALAGPPHPSPLKASTYASGEAAPFAVLHLGVLMLATGGLTPVAGVYLAALILTLLAVILG
jgi:hypothetical protein